MSFDSGDMIYILHAFANFMIVYSASDAAAYAASAGQQGAGQGGYPTAEQMYGAQGYNGVDPSSWVGQ